jgi:hypothetical protein
MQTFSIDLPFDGVPGEAGYGQFQMLPDRRPGMWGLVASYDVVVGFQNVPSGKRVQLLRFRGTFTAGLRGSIAPGSVCWLDIGLITMTNPSGAPGIQYFGPKLLPGGYDWSLPFRATVPMPGIDPRTSAQAGCPMYSCISLGDNKRFADLQIDEDLSQSDPLDVNNTLLIGRGVFLNDTGCALHNEFTGAFTYELVDAP